MNCPQSTTCLSKNFVLSSKSNNISSEPFSLVMSFPSLIKNSSNLKIPPPSLISVLPSLMGYSVSLKAPTSNLISAFQALKCLLQTHYPGENFMLLFRDNNDNEKCFRPVYINVWICSFYHTVLTKNIPIFYGKIVL